MFKDRRNAGRQLAVALQHLRGLDAVVLALPRGGVPVAYEVAESLSVPLDILPVRKLGAPGHKELAIGAVADGPEPVILLDERLVRLVAPPPGYVEAETRRELAEMARRRERFAGTHARAPIARRLVILVDDGIATGATARAALQAVRKLGASRRVLAVPVAAADSLPALEEEADEVVCLLRPTRMGAVGQYYEAFEDTPDDEVTTLLEAARARWGRDHQAGVSR